MFPPTAATNPPTTPPTATTPPSHATSAKSLHSRNSSMANAALKMERQPSRRKEIITRPDVHFTMLIRLPFARGDFVDPPQVEWDSLKDKALWKIISRSAKSSDLDWEELAQKFEVSPAFMLQQAAWLYERHLTHVRQQMRKVGGSNTATAGSGSMNTPAQGGVPMKRLGSGGGSAASPNLSALPLRPRDSPVPRADGSMSSTPRPSSQLSRTPSTNTITQSRQNVAPSSPRQPPHRSFRSNFPVSRKASPALPPPNDELPRPDSPQLSPSPPSASSSSSSDADDDDSEPNPIRRSQMFKRPPRFGAQKPSLARVDDEDGEASADDEEGSFLPFANPHPPSLRSKQSPYTSPPELTDLSPPPVHSNTNQRAFSQAESSNKGKERAQPPTAQHPPTDSSTSSINSSALGSPQARTKGRFRDRSDTITSAGAMSPAHRAELARLSPRVRGKAREGSDGTPSMGSSFSDLDGESVTQSALEEALLSNMQHGRMSTFSQLRSRYL